MPSKLFFPLFSAVGFFLYGTPAFALEVQYPSLPPFNTLTQTSTLPELFQFFFVLALWTAGIMLLGGVLYVGFQYMTSGGNPGKQQEARRRFAGVVMGAAMLFGVFILLQTINPELTSLKNLTFGICNGPDLPDCPKITGPTITGTGTTGGSTGGSTGGGGGDSNPAPDTNYASQLYNALRAACGRFINSSDVGAGCLGSLPSAISAQVQVIATIKNSALTYNALQCVGFVRAITQGLGQDIGPAPGGIFGAAKNFIGNPPNGYSYITKGAGTLQAGDIVLYKYAPSGHIAYVTQTLADKFKIVQANAGTKDDGNLTYREDNINNTYLAGWLRKN